MLNQSDIPIFLFYFSPQFFFFPTFRAYHFIIPSVSCSHEPLQALFAVGVHDNTFGSLSLSKHNYRTFQMLRQCFLDAWRHVIPRWKMHVVVPTPLVCGCCWPYGNKPQQHYLTNESQRHSHEQLCESLCIATYLTSYTFTLEISRFSCSSEIPMSCVCMQKYLSAKPSCEIHWIETYASIIIAQLSLWNHAELSSAFVQVGSFGLKLKEAMYCKNVSPLWTYREMDRSNEAPFPKSKYKFQ